MKKWFTLCALMICVGVANAQAEYPDVPLTDSAYTDFKLLRDTEVMGICVYPAPIRKEMTRYEFAVFIARLVVTSSTDKIEVREHQLPVTIQQALALKHLSQEFQSELQSLGVPAFVIEERRVLDTNKNPPQSETQFFVRPVPVAPPFPDVPKNHWAFSAVEKLRQDGVLLGYLNGAAVEAGK